MLVVFLLPCVNAYAAQPTEYDVKAAFIHNIVKFVEWPTGSSANLQLCIMGQSPFTEAATLLAGKKIGQQVWEVRQVDSRESLSECRVLFIAASESGDLRRILDGIQASGILTVGDSNSYAEQGVMVNFYPEQDKLRFEINVAAANRAGLRISSQLLKLARIVHETESMP